MSKLTTSDYGAFMLLIGIVITGVVAFQLHWAAGWFTVAFWFIAIGISNVRAKP